MPGRRTGLTVLIALTALTTAAAPAGARVPTAVAAQLHAAALPAGQLQRSGTTRSFGTTFYRFRQTTDGVPVLGSDTVVADGPAGRGDLVVGGATRSVERPLPATISATTALILARRALDVRSLRARPRVSRAALARRGRARLVYDVLLPAASPLADLDVLVDARTGRVLRASNLLEGFTGSAQIYDPDPVKMHGSFAGLSDHRDADSALLTSLRMPVVLEDLTSPNCLIGRWARVVLPTVPTREGHDYGTSATENSAPSADVCAPGADFDSVTRSDRVFEALMGYFHVDRAQSYIQALGFSAAHGNPIDERRILIRADQESDDNSTYSPITKSLTLGIGGVPDGQDAEVFVHEYGHSVQDAQAPSFNHDGDEQAGAIGEGFSDYFAADVANTFRPIAGTLTRFGQTAPIATCWSPWDNLGGDPGTPNEGPISRGPCERRVDETRTPAQLRALGPHDHSVPADSCGSDPHCLGEAWSGALWAIRSRLGNVTADRVILQSQFSYTRRTRFNGAARALVAADGQLDRGANQPFLRRLLCDRRLLATNCPSGKRR